MPRLEGFAAESSRAAIAEFVDWLLLNPMYNVRAVPDGVERAVYINCFELLTNLLAGALSTFEVDLMGRDDVDTLNTRHSNLNPGNLKDPNTLLPFIPIPTAL